MSENKDSALRSGSESNGYASNRKEKAPRPLRVAHWRRSRGPPTESGVDSATTLAAYDYSPEGLIAKRDNPGGAGVTHHLYSGGQEILEFTGTYASATEERRYIRLPGSVDEVVRRE